MNWKREALERLENYRLVRQSVHSLQTELHRLTLAARTPGANCIDKICVRGSFGKAEDRLLDNITRRQAVEEALEQTELWLQATEQAVACLDLRERQLLEGLYLSADRGNASALAEQMGMERSTFYRKRDEALRQFSIALFGKSDL